MQSKHIKQAPSNKLPPKPVDVAKAAALRELSSKSFRLKTWSLSQLPNDFWNTDDRSTPGALQEFSEKGSIAMRKLLFDELPLLVPASDNEWQVRNQRTALHNIYSA
jgi:Flp pilus assembly protein CpaB